MKRDFIIHVNGSIYSESAVSAAEALNLVLCRLPLSQSEARVAVYVPGNVIMTRTMVDAGLFMRTRSKQKWKRCHA